MLAYASPLRFFGALEALRWLQQGYGLSHPKMPGMVMRVQETGLLVFFAW